MPNKELPTIRAFLEDSDLESSVTIDKEKHLVFKFKGVFYSVDITELENKNKKERKKESEVQELKDKLEFECNCWNNELKIKESKIEKLQKEIKYYKEVKEEDTKRLDAKDHEWEEKIKKIVNANITDSGERRILFRELNIKED